MNNVTIRFLFILIISLTMPASAQDEWEIAAKGKDFSYYVKLDEKTVFAPIKTALIKSVHVSGEYSINRERYNCYAKTYQITERKEYSSSDEILQPVPALDTEWRKVTDESVGGSILRYVCVAGPVNFRDKTHFALDRDGWKELDVKNEKGYWNWQIDPAYATGEMRRFWLRRSKDDRTFVYALIGCDCPSWRYRILRFIKFDKDGKELSYQNIFDTPWQHPSDTLLSATCVGYKPPAASRKLPSAPTYFPRISPSTTPLPADRLYARVLPSVVTIIATDRNGDESYGSGFIGIRPGAIITARHVVEDAVSVVIKFSNGEKIKSSGWIDTSAAQDVAILATASRRALLPLALTSPPIGGKVYTIGAPRGQEFSISDGLLSQMRRIQNVNHYQVTCPVSPGNSGGPLFNDKGEVAGIVVWQLRDAQNLNFALPVTYALSLDSSAPIKQWPISR